MIDIKENFNTQDHYQRVELIKREMPVPFYSKLLLHHEFNFFYGSQKIGKTRALILMICKAMNKFQDKRFAILSTDNDANTTISPLLEKLKSQNKFIWINPDIAKKFKSLDLTSQQKIEIFLSRIKKFAKDCQFLEGLLLDPLPRFMNWNNESQVNMMIDGLRDIAKQYKLCIIGVRNEGKNKEYSSKDAFKGSSAIIDDSRQVIRALACHRKSAFGKEVEKENTLIIYTELSSLNAQVGYFIRLHITEDDIAVPVLIRQLLQNISVLKFLCTPESGRSITSQIFSYLNEQKSKGCTLQDLYDLFEGRHEHKIIRNAVYKNFDTTKSGGITLVQMPSKT